MTFVAPNLAWAEKNRRPKGCAEFGLGLRCSSVTAPLAGMLWCPCGSTSRLATRPNWAQQTSSNLRPGPLRPRPPSAWVVSLVLLLGVAGAALELFAQRVESVKEKTLNIRGVQIKKETPFLEGNYHYQMELINTTNEAMVVDVEVAFSNDETAS